jgi:hypothetical protein
MAHAEALLAGREHRHEQVARLGVPTEELQCPRMVADRNPRGRMLRPEQRLVPCRRCAQQRLPLLEATGVEQRDTEVLLRVCRGCVVLAEGAHARCMQGAQALRDPRHVVAVLERHAQVGGHAQRRRMRVA